MSRALHEARLGELLRRRELVRLLDALEAAGDETRVVGGAVRNALLGHAVDEIDLATTAVPPTVMRRARKAGLKAVPTGIDHGTVTVVVEGTPFEVTTLREDVETHGRRATVRFGRDFAADARRRDFTINALSLDRAGRIHDYAGGLRDLADRRVRFIGEPAQRIREDYLRILRFFRFHAAYGSGPPDPEGLAAVIRERAGIAILSRERIGAEFLKLIATRGAESAIAVLSETGLLAWITAGVGDLGRFARAVAADAGGNRGDRLRRLAGLAVAVVEDAERLQERLRLSNADTGRLAAYARLAARLRALDHPLDTAEARRLAVVFGRKALEDASALTAGEPRPILTPDGAAAIARLASGAEPVPVFPLRGADLLARGVPPGRRVGALLGRFRKAWIEAGCPPEAWAGALLDERLPAAGLSPATDDA